MSTATSTSQASLSCARCGYDLRGLARDANCPECGLPLERSLYGDFLKHQDPRWLNRLALGTVWMVVGSVANLVFSGYFLFLRGAFDWNVMLASALPLRVIAPVAIVATNLVGIVLITTPQPGQREPLVSSRRVLRVGSGVVAILGMGGYLPLLREPPMPLFWMALGVLSAAAAFASGLFLCGLALRVPSGSLAAQAALAAVAAVLLEFLQNLYPWVVYAVGVTRPVELPRIRMFPLQVASWVLGLYVLYLLGRFYRVLGSARAEGVAAAGKPVAGEAADGRA